MTRREVVSLKPSTEVRKRWLLSAFEHQQRGRLEDAERVLGRLLDGWPQDPDVLHVQGILRQRRGDSGTAVELIRRAVDLRADNFSYHNSLGIIHLEEGRLEESEACFRRQLELAPDNPQAHYNLGNLHQKRGKLDRAVARFRRAIELRADYAKAHNNLGGALRQQEDLEQAIPAIRRAIELDPELDEAYANLGMALCMEGDHDGAAAVCRQGLERDPCNPELYNTLGAALLGQSRRDEAVEIFGKAMELAPEGSLEACYNLVFLLQRLQRDGEAVEVCRRLVARQPGSQQGHFLLALLLLCTGKLAEGWEEYEWRWPGGPGFKKPGCEQPLWDGAPLAGRRILLVDEQGLGDTIHFIRYAPRVQARGGVVYAECAPPLGRLLATAPGIDRLVVGEEDLPDFDLQVPLVSLPRIFGTELDDVPAEIPYLSPAAQGTRGLDRALSRVPGELRVGIVWAGSPVHPADGMRSCAVTEFRPLARVPGVRLFSLQFGERAGDLREFREPVVDLGPVLGDFAHTAAILERLDLLVTVDTSIAHLAGATGRPAWVLLCHRPDWRWLMDREGSPWYPTLRLFRQPRPGDWKSVFREVAGALRGEVDARTQP